MKFYIYIFNKIEKMKRLKMTFHWPQVGDHGRPRNFLETLANTQMPTMVFNVIYLSFLRYLLHFEAKKYKF